MNVPKTKAEELQVEVVALCESPSPDQFTLKRLKRLKAKIEKLKPIDPPMAFNLLGMLAGAEHDPDEVRENFKKALQFPNPPEIKFIFRLNYIAALGRMNFPDEALVLCHQLFEKFPESTRLIEPLLQTTLSLGRLQEAVKWLRKANEFKLLDNEIKKGSPLTLIACAEFLAQEGVTDDETQQMTAPALAILRKKRILIRKQTVSLFSDEDSTWVTLEFHVPRTVKEIVEMNVELAKAMVSIDIPSEVLCLFNVSFSTPSPQAD